MISLLWRSIKDRQGKIEPILLLESVSVTHSDCVDLLRKEHAV
jgi:hypothetical protein